MKLSTLFLFLLFQFKLLGQQTHGTVHYKGRVTHLLKSDNEKQEIPFDQQRTDQVFADIYFNENFVELDAIMTIYFSQNTTYNKEKDWLLNIAHEGSNKTVETIQLKDLAKLPFQNLEFRRDTTRYLAGMKCHLATYLYNNKRWEVWYTNDISFDANLLNIPDEIEGACLEFTLHLNNLDILYSAYLIERSEPNPKRFEMTIPIGYELKENPLFPVQTTTIPSGNTTGKSSPPPTPPPPPVLKKN